MTEQMKKTYIHDYGIIAGIVIFLFSILLLTAILTRNTRNSNLEKECLKILESKYPDTYTIKDIYPLTSGFSSESKAFELASKKNADEKKYAIILNITTLYGPYPAVFLCSDNGGVNFVDFLCVEPDFSSYLIILSANSSISYWTEKIPKILALSEDEK